MMTPIEVLKAARAKIEKPENWTRNAPARNADGQRVVCIDPTAVCWCAYGAIIASYEQGQRGEDQRAAYMALRSAMSGEIEDFNDTHTHVEVMAAFDRAIAELEGRK